MFQSVAPFLSSANPRAFLTKRLAHQQAATPPVHTGLDMDGTSGIGQSAPGEFECIEVGTFESFVEGDLSSDADEAGDQDGPGCSKSASMSKFEAERRRLERQRNDEIAAKNVERKKMEELIVLLTKVGAVETVPQSLIQKVLSEKDPKGFHHYLLAQALLTHLKYHHCDTAPLLDIDWQDTLLSHFGPSVVDKQIVLPPPPPKAHVVAQEQRPALHHSHLPPCPIHRPVRSQDLGMSGSTEAKHLKKAAAVGWRCPSKHWNCATPMELQSCTLLLFMATTVYCIR